MRRCTPDFLDWASVVTQSELVGLTGDCTVSTINQHHTTLSEAFQSKSSIELDLAQVTAADVTLAQLIVSASKTATLKHRAFALRSVSDSMRALLCSAGVIVDLKTGQVSF